MFAAALATALFALSSVSARRSVDLLGSNRASLLRILLAAAVLAGLAHTVGQGLRGPALGWFLVSGVIGFGICDTAIFLALPRLGAQLTSLLVQCLAAPVAVVAEWLWLDTRLGPATLAAGLAILAGVLLALYPDRRRQPAAHPPASALALGVLAAVGQALGAVLSRHGQQLAASAGQPIDGITVAYQRILAGVAFIAAWWWWQRRLGPPEPALDPARLRQAAPWVAVNGLSGPSLGVACYQWALGTAPTGLVLTLTALTPLAVIPISWALEGERPTPRSLGGGIIAVAGVVALVLAR